jgi:hypothetical protein
MVCWPPMLCTANWGRKGFQGGGRGQVELGSECLKAREFVKFLKEREGRRRPGCSVRTARRMIASGGIWGI